MKVRSISNYHLHKIDNGFVEGKNCAIKPISRQIYGIKNHQNYVNLLLVRCNRHLCKRGRKKRKVS
ncbi:transposase [Pasteuria penetrans]|uniref:transposase n=1 Tax=Pasteuria penetrans TaxID=86005 RepID=UPI000FB75916